jgi:hypothetical protein
MRLEKSADLKGTYLVAMMRNCMEGGQWIKMKAMIAIILRGLIHQTPGS